MATVLELCAQLGFLDTSHEGPSRGLPKVLLDDMKKYAKFRQSVRDDVLLADAYLFVANAGEKHWPGSEIPQWGFLAWGVDDGRRVQPISARLTRYLTISRIKELVTALFGLITNSERADRVVIDLEGDDTMTSNEGHEQQVVDFQSLPAAERAQTATGDGQSRIVAIQVEDHKMTAYEGTKQPIEESQGLLSAKSDHRALESVPSQLVVSQGPGPITRLARKDPNLIWNLLDNGRFEPFPIVADSEAELVMTLNDWIGENPGRYLPGAVPLQSQFCGYKHPYKKELTFACTSEHVWVERFKIDQKYMGWILKEADGSCMLVEPAYGNGSAWRGYYGWLGADRGFSFETVAYTGVWDPALVKYVSQSVLGAQGQEHVLEPGTQPKEHSRGKLLVEATKESFKRTRESSGVDQIVVKKEPSRSEVRQAAVRQNKTERERRGQRWRSDTPPLSSLDIVEKFRWPPQYKSPPPASRHRELRIRSTTERQTAGSAPVAPRNLHEKSSSPELVSAGPATASPGTRRSTRSNCSIRFMGDHMLTLDTPPKKPKKKGTKPQIPMSPAPTSTPIQPSLPESTAGPNVSFHFFLSDESMGAHLVPLVQCNTVNGFFDRAEAAWDFLNAHEPDSQFAGVRVVLEGILWPMVVGWKDSHGYQWMMDTVAKSTIGRMNDLHVQVRCIKK